MLIQPWHDLDEIARPVTVIELMQKDAVPGILAGARRRQKILVVPATPGVERVWIAVCRSWRD